MTCHTESKSNTHAQQRVWPVLQSECWQVIFSRSEKWEWTWCCRRLPHNFDEEGVLRLWRIKPKFTRQHGAEPRESHHPFAVSPNPLGTWKICSALYCSSKASDTVLLVKWLHGFISVNILNPIVDGYAEVSRQMQQVCGATLWLNNNKTYSHGLWMPHSCVIFFAWTAWHFFVVAQFWDGGPSRWGSRLSSWSPSTTHYTIWPFMFENNFCRGHHLSSNPARTVNEDFLGRIARLSRRVGLRLMDLCLIECYFLKTVSLLYGQDMNKQTDQQEWGSNGTSKNDAIMRNGSRCSSDIYEHAFCLTWFSTSLDSSSCWGPGHLMWQPC